MSEVSHFFCKCHPLPLVSLTHPSCSPDGGSKDRRPFLYLIKQPPSQMDKSRFLYINGMPDAVSKVLHPLPPPISSPPLKPKWIYKLQWQRWTNVSSSKETTFLGEDKLANLLWDQLRR